MPAPGASADGREVVAILGAGAMGSALTAPPAHGEHDVRLWGTWLDDELVAALRAGEPHPRTGVRIDPRVRVFDSSEMAMALDAATIVALAISSEGVIDVLGRAAQYLDAGQLLPITTKGFARDDEGRVSLLPPLLQAKLPAALRERESIVVIGGPCKANEVGSGRPTGVVFGAAEREAAEQARAVFQTAWYRIEVTDDVAGVEISAALKNVYAIALGVCQGLAGEGGEPWHDLQAAVFAQAAREMAAFAVAVGGRAETAAGLAGVGDLEVTGLSGRNRIYGERIGRGEKPEQALQAMQDAGQTVEGVPAADLAMELLGQLSRDNGIRPDRFPLLAAVHALLADADAAAGRLADACLPALVR
jgi:glycerol-3-phosphate dehydrogenase (NAD(P)+)